MRPQAPRLKMPYLFTLMLTHMKLTALLAAAALLLAGCSGSKMSSAPKSDFKKTASGLQYKLYPAKATGQEPRKPQEGEFMSLHMAYDNGADSVLFSTYDNGYAIQVPVMALNNPGGIEEGFAMLSPGDSAVFRISSDSLFANTFKQPLPPIIKPGSFMTFRVKLEDIFTEAQAQEAQQRIFEQEQKKMALHAQEQAKIDDELIRKYIQEQGLAAKRTDSGLYYVITKPGTGPNAKAGQLVSVHYTGTTLNGQKFDSSLDRGQPIQFPLGQGQVIRGWDEGIALLNKGAKATLLIPSPMANVERSPPPAIPANSVLRFDVELVDMQE